jgi:hypothetical protein
MTRTAAGLPAINRLVAHQPVIERAALQVREHGKAPTVDTLAVAQFRDLVALASQHLTVANGLLVLDEAPLRKRDVAAIDLGLLRKNIEITNHLVSSQALALGGNLELRPISPFFWQGSLLKCENWEASAEQHWWGSCICMNEALTWAIIEQLEAGAAALTILAMLEACGVVTALGAVATAIVGLVVIAGALALIAADRGDGVCICLLHFPPGQILVMPR